MPILKDREIQHIEYELEIDTGRIAQMVRPTAFDLIETIRYYKQQAKKSEKLAKDLEESILAIACSIDLIGRHLEKEICNTEFALSYLLDIGGDIRTIVNLAKDRHEEGTCIWN